MSLVTGQSHQFTDNISVKEVVRLKKIEFTDFRNISKGCVEFPCTSLDDIRENSPSILGIYGQNGSGKTSVLMALSILKRILTGKEAGHTEDSYIRDGCERCTLSYMFEVYFIMKHKDETIKDSVTHVELFYKFDLSNQPDEFLSSAADDIPDNLLFVENEILQMREYQADGTIKKSKQTLIDTSVANSDEKGIPFGSKTKFEQYIDVESVPGSNAVAELSRLKKDLYTQGKSFIFAGNITDRFRHFDSADENKSFSVFLRFSTMISTVAREASEKHSDDLFVFSPELSEKMRSFAESDTDRAFAEKFQQDQHAILNIDEFLSIIHDIDDIFCNINPKYKRCTLPAKRSSRHDLDNGSLNNNMLSEVLCEMFDRVKKLSAYEESECKPLISSLKEYGRYCLHIVDTSITGQTNMNTSLPLLLWGYQGSKIYSMGLNLYMDKKTSIPANVFNIVTQSVASINTVLKELVPGLQLGIADFGTFTDEKNVEKHVFTIQSVRGDVIIPLKYESDGVRRIVSLASLFIAVYNEPSFTLAVDEIDAGIFEYLLGELFQVLSESAQGQFIFTSHNLRPLEVLPAQNLCFTSVNPENRFVKLRKRGNCNLRDTYFRMIILGSGSDAVYESTDRYKLQRAFLKAGREGILKE